MTRHDTIVALQQMLEAARRAVAITSDRSRDDLDSDGLLYLAVVRVLEVLGEAASRVPRSDRARHPAIPWAEVVGLRNRLIHGYDAVDLDIVWSIVKDDVPALLVELERAIEVTGPPAADD